MRRRDFLSLAGVAPLLASPVRAQGNVPVVGFLNPVSPDTYAFNAQSFRDGLAQSGFVEGRNVHIEYRWSKGDYSRLPAMAAELVAMQVAVIAATGDIASARAAKAATTTIPIVFTVGADPVGHGLVASLGRPGGNLTGVNLFSSILSAKRVELLTQIAPKVRRIALVMNPDNLTAAAEQQEGITGARARSRGVRRQRAQARRDRRRPRRSAAPEGRFVNHGDRSADPRSRRRDRRLRADARSARDRLCPPVRDGGALLSYGPSITWMHHQAGIYVGEVLRGAKPAELPVVQPTGFELVVNLKTAAALGLDAPPPLLLSATEVLP